MESLSFMQFLPLVFDKFKGAVTIEISGCSLIVSFLSGTSGSIVVCVSPLTSIMMDQRAKFTPMNLCTEFVGEQQTDRSAEIRVCKGEVQLVLISPESLIEVPKYRNMLLSKTYQEKLVALVVDEAHCVKKWGDRFRTAFAQIGELRSIIPKKVKILALTATATSMTYHVVCERLSMVDPLLVAMPPHRPNIGYRVKAPIKLDQLSSDISIDLKLWQTDYPKTVVFVRSYRDCCDLYMSIERKLGRDIFYPSDSPSLSKFRMVDIYSSVSTVEKKESVLQFFKKVGSTLRVVIATVSLGMGVDCPDIRKIIHWGVPEDLEQYVQESGRAGRDGESAEAILYSGKVGKHPTKRMRAYLANNTMCRRKFIFEEFLCYSEKDIHDTKFRCCDLCTK